MVRETRPGQNRSMVSLAVRQFDLSDLNWAEALIGTDFGGRLQARLGELVDAFAWPGFVVELEGERSGIVTFAENEHDIEIIYLETTHRHQGVGTRLIDAVVERSGGRRVWLVTTNDNLDALRFYQRRGFRLSRLRAGAADEARRHLKPGIPTVGHFGIPIRDEIVLEREDPCARTAGTRL
jgi:ribosomal protein S18 acetylase RimI-like enzyme